MTRVALKITVLEAAMRLMDHDEATYPGLHLSGNEDSANKFTKDVILVCEAIMQLVDSAVPQ